MHESICTYNGVTASGYKHEVAVESADELDDIKLSKRHLVISLLKRWILGTMQGNVGKDHLQDYLNEFTFRFNRRSARNRGLLFYRLAQQAVATVPNPRATIVPAQDVVAG
jgi:hypothetical protein